MANTDPIERFHAMREVAERRRTLQAEVMAARGPGPLAGDLYAPPVRFRAALAIALTHPHPKDSREWFAVVVDDVIEAGCADVIVPGAAPWGPLVLRCGLGVWLDVDALAELVRVGMIPDAYAQEAVRRLANLVRGTAEPTARQEEVEATPEYKDWMPRVAADRASLERWRDGRGLMLSIASFGPEVPESLGFLPAGERSGSNHRLAASSGSLLDELAEAIGDEAPVVWRTIGDLAFRAGREGVDVFWLGASGAGSKPPRIRGHSTDGQAISARWGPVGDDASRRKARPTFPWRNGEVTLTVGAGRGETVTIRG